MDNKPTVEPTPARSMGTAREAMPAPTARAVSKALRDVRISVAVARGLEVVRLAAVGDAASPLAD